MTKKPAQVFHFDLYGKRDDKYDFLNENSMKTIEWQELNPQMPELFFVPKDFEVKEEYDKGFSVADLFPVNGSGIVSKRDSLAFQNSKIEIQNKIEDLNELSCEDIKKKYSEISWESRDGKVEFVKENISKFGLNDNLFVRYNYRLFDEKWTYYTGASKGFIGWPVKQIMQHLLKDNLAFICSRQSSSEWKHIFISKLIGDFNITGNAGTNGSGYYFPLYLYPETTTQHNLLNDLNEGTGRDLSVQSDLSARKRVPNLNMEIVNKMAAQLGIPFVAEKSTLLNSPPLEGCPTGGVVNNEFAPIDILDYIYAVLHSPSYRSTYAAFLKIDFPRVPYPKNQQQFIDLVALGSQLRQIHLLESEVVEKLITQYPEDGTNIVVKPRFVNSPPLEAHLTEDVLNSPPLEGCPTGGVVPLEECLKGEVVANAIINTSPIYFKPKLDLPCNIKLKPRAKELRQAENLSEVLFWMQVTKGQFYKIDFDRQRIIGNYIVDFYVKKLGLIIEFDGSSHDNKEKYDADRDAYFESLGLKVYHIPVVEVLQQMKLVMKKLEDYIIENYGLPPRDTCKYVEEPTHHLETSLKEPPHPAGTPPKEGNLGNVFINETQYFANVPEVAWNFYIGGYQPAQKWLKDRKDRELNYEDIRHYQKIIVALTETDRLMKEIDTIEL